MTDLHTLDAQLLRDDKRGFLSDGDSSGVGVLG